MRRNVPQRAAPYRTVLYLPATTEAGEARVRQVARAVDSQLPRLTPASAVFAVPVAGAGFLRSHGRGLIVSPVFRPQS